MFTTYPRDKLVLTARRSMRWRPAENEQGSRHYDVIVAPSSPRKRRSPPRIIRWFSGSLAPRPSPDQAVEGLFDVKVDGVNTLVPRARRRPFAACAQAERREEAVVTLAEAIRST